MSELLERIHPDGPEVSRISAGMLRLPTWNYSDRELGKFIEAVVERGITTIDSADIYGDYLSQPLFGRILKDRPELRGRMQLVSKCGNALVSENRPENKVNHYNTTKEHIRNSVETSLKDLHTDYLDLLLIHRPSPLMNIDEIAGILSDLAEEGKIRYAGVSNFTPMQFVWLQERLDIPLVTNQIQASLLFTDTLFNGTFNQLQRDNIRPMIWSPLKGGALFYRKSHQAVRVRITLLKLAEKYGCSIDVLALAWLLQLPSKPFPVVGTGNILHIDKAVKSASLDLDRQDWFELLEASLGEPVP
ncbi:MAG: aldo/keto reductase [Balneolaceae bacterium]